MAANNTGSNIFAGCVIVIVVGILIAIAMPNFIKVKDKAKLAELRQEIKGLELQMNRAGIDTGSDGYLADMAPGSKATASGALNMPDARYTTADDLTSPHSPSASPGSGSITNMALVEAGLLARVESWFLPKAYAQDHGIDEQYLVRQADCNLKVEKFDDSVQELESIAAKYSGLIADSHSSKDHEGSVSGWVRLRIPAEQFDAGWKEIKDIGEVLEANVKTDDVSQQYVGTVSRLKNLMAEEAVLTKMLDEALEVQRKRGLGEGYSILLDTQERLFAVTGQIQSTEDTLNSLSDKITRSTITVNMTEVKQLPQQVKEEFTWGFGATAGQGFKDLQLRLRAIGNGLLYFLITCWTWLIPWAIIIWLGSKLWRRWIAPKLAEQSAAVVAAGDKKQD